MGFCYEGARKRAWLQGARCVGNADILDNMSRQPKQVQRSKVPDCAASVETV